MICTETVEKHKNFKTKQNFTLTLVSDSERILINELGTKNHTGRYLRNVMVCDTNNKCIKHWRDVKEKDKIADSVIEWIKNINKN